VLSLLFLLEPRSGFAHFSAIKALHHEIQRILLSARTAANKTSRAHVLNVFPSLAASASSILASWA
jgi:hypothetical protein